MDVDAAEAEGIDTGAAHAAQARDPRPGLGIDVERRRRNPEIRVDRLAQGRRQHPVMQRQRGLDQAGDARCRNAMADHRLDRAERDRALRGAALAEHVLQRRDLGLVAERNAGAVRLEPG
jgi:hypothetical protein